MIVKCAWCAPNAPAMYEKEPFDDPRITHSICETHQTELLNEVLHPSCNRERESGELVPGQRSDRRD